VLTSILVILSYKTSRPCHFKLATQCNDQFVLHADVNNNAHYSLKSTILFVKLLALKNEKNCTQMSSFIIVMCVCYEHHILSIT